MVGNIELDHTAIKLPFDQANAYIVGIFGEAFDRRPRGWQFGECS
jgi:hypothetical protein